MGVDVRYWALQRVGKLDLQRVFPGAVQVQDAPAVASCSYPLLRKELDRGLLDGLGRRKGGEEHQGIFDAGFFLRELEAHSESEIVVVLSGFIDEEVPGTSRLALVPPGKPPPAHGHTHQNN